LDAQNMIEPKFEASVGMSRKWDAREAGREVARNTIEKLNRPPDFFLLFSTIHYEKHGGFQEFLNGVWDVLPKGTPLIGGTAVGFLNNYGCYTRGTSALAVSYTDMDVAIGYGKNTKRNPKKAATQSTENINKNFKNTKFKNKFVLNLISGPELIRIPGQGYKKIVDSGIISKFVVQAFGVSQYLFQKGIGREDEVFEEIIDKLPSCNMVMSTSIDDNKGIRNYQFFNESILTNSVVNLGLSLNLDIGVCTTHGMKETDTKFNITKLNRNKHIILEINNRPAVPELYKILNWPNNFLNEETMHYRILYYPISLRRHGRDVPIVMPAILKDYIVTPCIIDKGEVKILTISGRDLIYAIQNNLKSFGNIQPEFGLCSTCSTIMQTMGNKIYVIKEKMMEYFKEKPFLMFFCAGEGTYSPTQDYTYANMSYNTAIFGQ